MDAQGGYAPIKSFKDSMDTFGDKNQYVQNQVGVQTWAQWYVNVLAGTKDDISVAAVPIKTLEGKPLGHGVRHRVRRFPRPARTAPPPAPG